MTIAVTPSVGALALADGDTTLFTDFSSALPLQPATLASLPLVDVSGFAEIDLGGTYPKSVLFTMDDVKQRVTKTVASSLADEVELDVEAAGLGLGADALLDQVASNLALIAPPVDSLPYEASWGPPMCGWTRRVAAWPALSPETPIPGGEETPARNERVQPVN